MKRSRLASVEQDNRKRHISPQCCPMVSHLSNTSYSCRLRSLRDWCKQNAMQQTPDQHNYVTRRRGGTVSWWLATKRRWCRDAVSETGAQCAVRYCGAVPSWHRRIIMQSLYLMHWGTSSRWRPACSSYVRPRSNFLVPLTTRAAAFNTLCSLLVTDFGAPTKMTLQ